MNKLINEIGSEDLLNLFIDAFEGGSNYWYQIVEHSREYQLVIDDSTVYDSLKDTLDGNLQSWVKINAPDYPEFEPALITCKSIENGLRSMMQDNPRHFIELIRNNGDAETSDVFLQHVVFGKVIFG